VGYSALAANTTGTENVALGQNSLTANTTGSYNTAIGRGALAVNTTASNITVVGFRAGINSTGAQNTFIGADSGGSNTTGNLNTFVGADSGYYVTTGAKNTIIGKFNGNQGGLDIRTASNHIVLSDGDGNPRGIFDSSGNWLVGKTSNDSNVEGAVLYGDSATGASAAFTSDGIRTIIANRKTDDGEIISIRNNGTTVGSIGVVSTYLTIGKNDTGLLFMDDTLQRPLPLRRRLLRRHRCCKPAE
jgi:hypothetical protein